MAYQSALRHLSIEARERLIGRAFELKAQGQRPYQIAAQLGVTRGIVTYWTDTDRRERIKAQNRASWKKHRAPGTARPMVHSAGNVTHGPSAADVAARLAEIPIDDRTLTGVVFGDPPSSRSALAQRTQS